MTESKRYNSILQVIDDHLIPDEEAKKQRGEVFTPPDLVREMLFGLRKDKLREGISEIFGIDKDGNFTDEDEENRVGGIPRAVWRNPDLKWLDPANGIGNFPVIAFYKLDYELSQVPGEYFGDKNKENRRKHIINEMLFMMELDKGNCVTSRQIFKKIHTDASPKICCADTLSLTYEEIKKILGVDKFDIIMGNPPFNPPKTETGSSGNYIWTNFVIKSFFMLNKNGYLCFVHPPGWKKPTNKVFNFETLRNGNHYNVDKTGKKTVKKIPQGLIWQYLKNEGKFEFIYTNDQKNKKGVQYLEHFPAVDYYIYCLNKDKSNICNSKNIFLGKLISSFDIKLKYDLKYLPTLITKEIIYIFNKVISNQFNNLSFRRGIDERHVVEWKGKKIKWYYDANKDGFQNKDYGAEPYGKKERLIDTVNIDKVVLNFGGGFNSYTVEFVSSEDQKGILDMTMYHEVESKKKGLFLTKFMTSDIVKFIFSITQYASGKMTKNEPLVANSLRVPEGETEDLYTYYDLNDSYKKYIADLLSKLKPDIPENGGNELHKTRKGKKCNDRQEIDPETGKCVQKCNETQERNPKTRKCVKKCKEDQVRNSNFKCKSIRKKPKATKGGFFSKTRKIRLN
jgi:hypothetical protein